MKMNDSSGHLGAKLKSFLRALHRTLPSHVKNYVVPPLVGAHRQNGRSTKCFKWLPVKITNHNTI